MAGEDNTTPDDLLKQTYFTKDKQTENKLAKHGFEKKLKDQIKDLDEEIPQEDADKIIEYLKTLTPSGIELEFISLASFDFDK